MLNSDYWDKRYQSKEIQWDLGEPSFPLAKYISQLENPFLKILIPGCGNGYEGELLWESGFDHVFLMDYAPSAKENFLSRVPDFPEDQFIIGDFFEHQGQYDLILEQTFFCALDPKLRPDYGKKMSELLVPGGKLVGLLFNDPLNDDRPPFGGNPLEYLAYFQPNFSDVSIKPCVNSIQPRHGREVFIKMVK